MTLASLRPPLVLLAAYLLLTAAGYWAGETYVAAWLPLFRLEIPWILPAALASKTLVLATTDGQHSLVLDVVTTLPLPYRNRMLPPGLGFFGATLQAYVLHHAVIAFTVLAAWPVPTWRRRLMLLALGVPCVLVTTSVDIPFVLSGLVHESFLENFAPQRIATDPLVLYRTFLQGGGRLGLALAGALFVAVAVGGRGERRRQALRVCERNVT